MHDNHTRVSAQVLLSRGGSGGSHCLGTRGVQHGKNNLAVEVEMGGLGVPALIYLSHIPLGSPVSYLELSCPSSELFMGGATRGEGAVKCATVDVSGAPRPSWG